MKGVIKQVGRYIVGEAIGEGSFGKVYKGIDQKDKSQVALKFISKRGKNKKQLEGLRTQNEMLKKICHRNIIKLLDFHETQNEMIIITEFAGENLSDVLEKKKNFTYQQVKAYCRQIFDALCYLDQNRIAHRDLKPQNILIQNQVIKICDFGFARKLSASTNFMNSLKGTPLYIAPQILGNGPLNYTKKVDVWSFGIIIYELFTGRPPFYAQNLPKLKPKILNDKVRFPKEMPVQVRTVIDRMLQKHPESRADWQELRKFQFFCPSQPLMEVSQNTQTKQAMREQYLKLTQEPLFKQEIDRVPLTPSKKQKMNKLECNQDVEQIKKIESDLMGLRIEGKKLRVDNSFFQKAMSIYTSFLSGEGVVTRQAILHLNSIFLFLLTKVKPADVDGSQDITRKKELLFCAIKITEQDNDPETIANELVLIGFLIRNNFDNVSIDFQTDQDILELCVRQIQANRSSHCFTHAFTVLGILANQGIISLNNSEQFFIKIEKEQILASIADAYEPIPSKKIVLECLEKFIHPNQFAATIHKSQIQLQKAFISMKQQVAKVLLQKKFLLQNPLIVYKQPAHVESYAKILYECINVSEVFRKQFLRNNFWIDFLQHKNLRIFCFAYDFICIQKDKVCFIPNEVMKGVALSQSMKRNSLMENVYYLARAQFYLSKKQAQSSNKQQSTLKLINQICQSLCIDEESKKKASREVEGFLFTGYRIFEEVLGQTLCNIFNDPIFDKNSIPENTLQIILQSLSNFKPEEQMRISVLTATKILIAFDDLLKLESSKIRNNKKILTVLGTMTTYFLENGLVFQINSQYGPNLTQRLLFAIFTVIKMYILVDEKQQFELYSKIEEKGIINLLILDSIIDKQTLSMCLTILLKISQKNNNNSIIDFTGINLIDKLKNFLMLDMEDDGEVVVQMIHILCLVIKRSEQYAGKFKQLQIIQHFPRYLQHPTNENLRHQTLNLIGNMAKHSTYFFEDFAANGIFTTIADTVKRFGHGSKNKVLKGIVYAVGNVSFYTDRFCKQFTLLLPSLATALASDEPYLVSNTMSTISNLLRHSNCYLKALVQCKIIKKVIQIVMQCSKADSNQLMFGLNMIKKVLAYPEIFEDHPRSEFIAIYAHRVKLVGEDNECMKKIKTLM